MRRLKKFVEGYDGIEGVHDLIVHNYGPGRSMASIHAEVPNDQEIEKSHETIDVSNGMRQRTWDDAGDPYGSGRDT